MAHEEILSETLKNYVTSNNNIKRTHMMEFGTLGKKHVQYKVFCTS